MCASFCEQMMECIENDAETRAAMELLLQELQQQQQQGGTQATPERLAQNVLSANTTCDNDLAWGNIRSGIVDRVFQTVIDVIEQIEANTDNQEMLSISLDSIPVLGQIIQTAGVASWLQFFDNVREWLADQFAAGDTLEKRDQVACDLFCIWQVECSLSIAQISEYFQANAEAEFPSYNDAFTGMVTLILALGDPDELTGDLVVDALIGSMFGFTNFINSWFGVTLAQVENFALLGEASDDWALLCDCPEEWEHVAELGELEFWDDYAGDDAGVWSEGNGWASDTGSTFRGMGIFGIATASPFMCLSVVVKITAAMTGDSLLLIAGNLTLTPQESENMGTALEFEMAVGASVSGLAIGYFPDSTIPGDPANFPGYTYEVTVRGSGYQPPELGG